MSNYFHIISLNCQGLRSGNKRARLKQYITMQKAEIVFIQESHFTPEISDSIREEFDNWNIYNAFGSNLSRGCSILVNKKFNCDIINFSLDRNGRYVLLNILVDNKTYTLVNLYANNDKKNRNDFFQNIHTTIENEAQGILILGGDFNDTLGVKDRLSKNNSQNVSKIKTTKSLLKLIKDHNLYDIWRKTFEQKTQFTWKRKNNTEKSRIDMWLIDGNLSSCVHSTDIRPACINYTDHLAISLKILKPNKRGPGYYKFNNSYLSDKVFTNFMSNTIQSFMLKYQDTRKQIFWDLLKTEIKEQAISYSKRKSANRQSQIEKFEKELKKLLENEEQNFGEIENLQQQLNELYDIKAKGAQIRARVEFIEQGEKNTKYFLRLEHSRQTRKILNKITNNGKIYTDTKDILEQEVDFYSKLYTSQNPDTREMQTYLSETIFDNKLSNSEANLCEGIFTSDECEIALKNMKLNKSPGADGLTAEFYSYFWNLLGKLITDVLNEGFTKSELSVSQRTGILSLLYKKGDPTNLENWRPISLLNVDYKIAARVLANRIQKVINKIVSLDQQGYIKNRFIGYNLRQIQDIIDYTELLELDGAIIFLDFRKAFDTVERSFLFETLEYFGFKKNFIRWIKTLYCNSQTFILNNGWMSKPFNPERGVRQGCPISALLFILVAEIMALNLRKANNIKGIKVKTELGYTDIRISQLADDTTLFLKSKTDIINALDIIKIFGIFSGLELNKKKTEAMWIGKQKASKETVTEINWSFKPIKALGIYFGHDKQKCEELNWQNKIEQCKTILNNWSKRKLTFYGKIQIIKTIVIPKLTYTIHSLVVPKHVKQELNKLLFAFLWDNKNEKIKRTTLIGNKNGGGIDMIDLESYITAMKIKWVKALTDKSNPNWKVIPNYFFSKFGYNCLIFNMNLDSIKSLDVSVLPGFYKNILELWISTKKNTVCPNKTKTFVEIRKEIIWGNRLIKHNGKCLFFKSWISSDILFVNDIVDKNGVLDANLIYNKLKDKTNWIAELSLLKKCLPKQWTHEVQKEQSKLTQIKTDLNIYLDNQDINIKYTTNKQIYQFLIKKKITKPYIHRYWNHYFEEEFDYFYFYKFINSLYDNKIKQFKYKLVNRIFPSKEIRFKWKMETNPNCSICNVIETYEHVFVDCPVIAEAWDVISKCFNDIGIGKNIKSMRTIVLGYKIVYPDYYYINTILALFGFCIYKSYFISESRSKPFNVIKLFKMEFAIYVKYLENKDESINLINKFKLSLQC